MDQGDVQADEQDEKQYHFYDDVNYAFCIIIFGQLIGVMCAKISN
jgi:hypothetical protein